MPKEMILEMGNVAEAGRRKRIMSVPPSGGQSRNWLHLGVDMDVSKTQATDMGVP